MDHIQIHSGSDHWYIEVINPDGDRVLKTCYWDHNDVDKGVGGEHVFADLLEYLGYTVYCEESY